MLLVHYISCPSKGNLVDDRNVHDNFAVLSLRTNCMKSFTCNNKLFSVTFLMKFCFSIKHFLYLNTPSLTAFNSSYNTEWVTDSSRNHEWNSIPNASISYNFAVSYFNFCYLYFQQEIKFRLRDHTLSM